MADITITVDGKKLTAPQGTLLIDACRKAGIEIPAFCSYPGLSPQAACRMCLVRQEKVGKLQTACTTHIAEGQVFFTDTDEIHQARRAMLELLLGNHPLDCPVCDAGGECELQDMVFKYGAGESLYAEAKNHCEEQQWSPAVFYDRPRCILCYRCIRICGEGMDVWALGVQGRGVGSAIAPNGGDRLDCEQCGMCIDICPVGALTSGSYHYKTRPWEMNHVATICTHCADGCKVTLGMRQADDGSKIVRADNRDHSGINGEFLCAKGRFGFDFVQSPERLTTPLVRNAEGSLETATWEQALKLAAGKLKEVRKNQGGAAIGVVGSNRATNEENYLLQKFARTVLGTNNIDHERTTNYAAFARALAGHKQAAASLREIAEAPAILLLGGNPTEEHPLLAWTLRTNVRLNRARLYVANARAIKLERQATATLRLTADGRASRFVYQDGNQVTQDSEAFRKAVLAEQSLVVIFGAEYDGEELAELVAWGLQRGNVRFAFLGDYANSRGAADMGVLPDLLPGYVPVETPGTFAAALAGGRRAALRRGAARPGPHRPGRRHAGGGAAPQGGRDPRRAAGQPRPSRRGSSRIGARRRAARHVRVAGSTDGYAARAFVLAGAARLARAAPPRRRGAAGPDGARRRPARPAAGRAPPGGAPGRAARPASAPRRLVLGDGGRPDEAVLLELPPARRDARGAARRAGRAGARLVSAWTLAGPRRAPTSAAARARLEAALEQASPSTSATSSTARAGAGRAPARLRRVRPLGVGGLPVRTPWKNLLLGGREVLPGLGLEGELYAGLQAAAQVAALLGVKGKAPA